jgi:phenylalanyl-tRNA synthetase alpha chain
MIREVGNEKELEKLRVAYLGKRGKLNKVFREMMKDAEDKRLVGQQFNQVKEVLEKEMGKKRESLEMGDKGEEDEWLDVTAVGGEIALGRMHPISQVVKEMNSFFGALGFSVMEGPEIETDEYNFQRLNLPKDHPARDLQDTLYIKPPKWLLRTHTSSVEARVLEKYEPPMRVVFPGKVYRYEATNPSNNVMFFQYQGFAVDKVITMANLRWVLEKFVDNFYGEGVETRFRCKYYPEVEPTAGMDISCSFCDKKGCSVCKGRGWLEILGCGMIHPNIMKVAGIDPENWSGFAWGMGLDRLVMTRFGISDIRDLTNGSITYPEV